MDKKIFAGILLFVFVAGFIIYDGLEYQGRAIADFTEESFSGSVEDFEFSYDSNLSSYSVMDGGSYLSFFYDEGRALEFKGNPNDGRFLIRCYNDSGFEEVGLVETETHVNLTLPSSCGEDSEVRVYYFSNSEDSSSSAGTSECSSDSDCGSNDCKTGFCSGGICEYTYADEGEVCNFDGGSVCDGAGECDECVAGAGNSIKYGGCGYEDNFCIGGKCAMCLKDSDCASWVPYVYCVNYECCLDDDCSLGPLTGAAIFSLTGLTISEEDGYVYDVKVHYDQKILCFDENDDGAVNGLDIPGFRSRLIWFLTLDELATPSSENYDACYDCKRDGLINGLDIAACRNLFSESLATGKEYVVVVDEVGGFSGGFSGEDSVDDSVEDNESSTKKGEDSVNESLEEEFVDEVSYDIEEAVRDVSKIKGEREFAKTTERVVAGERILEVESYESGEKIAVIKDNRDKENPSLDLELY